MDALPPALRAIAGSEQFVTWVALPNPEQPGKFSKFPCNWQTGDIVNAHDPANWTNAGVACATHALHSRGYGTGVGFVLTEADPFFFLDIDGALRSDNQWSALATQLCASFPGAYVEVSHSGKGLHIMGRGVIPAGLSTRNKELGLELYDKLRFVALTGYAAQGDIGLDFQPQLDALAPHYFTPAVSVQRGEWTTEPVAEWAGPEDDGDLVRLALMASDKSAAGAFGGKMTFRQLWQGDVPEDMRSEADQTLANHLAFWTGKNCERMERLMRGSGLLRAKWDAPGHRDYLERTIRNAIGFVAQVATGSRKQVAAVVTGDPTDPDDKSAATLRPLALEFLDPVAQIKHFEGCAFVIDETEIYSTQHNQLFNKAQFDVVFGGHMFLMDPNGQKKVDSAFDAFTKSRVNVPTIADSTCFRPEHPPGAIIREGKWKLVNTYSPHEYETAEGDVSRIFGPDGLMARQLPDPRDRAILTNYLAYCAQNIGHKAQWWPVLQGTKGNGKTFWARALRHIHGPVYTHVPNVAALAKDGMKFNSWVERHTLLIFEEVALSHRREFMEEMKPLITNEMLAIERKGVDQKTTDNRCNGFICTNFRDGVPVDDDERRYAVFFTAQQMSSDILHWRMDGNYFPDLYDWFRGHGAYHGQTPGAHMIAHFLRHFAMDDALNPAKGAARAPATSSTRAAVEASLGRAEQEVLEAIGEGRPGFCGGWVSSRYLDTLMDVIRAPVPRNKRREMMQRLGYDWHPALDQGRTIRPVMPDNAKPRLYIKTGHLALNLQGAKAVEDAYTKANTVDRAVNLNL